MNKYAHKLNNKIRSYFKYKNLSKFRVLDLGCGLGYNCIFLANKGANVVAVDSQVSKDLEKKNRKIIFIKSDIRKFKFKKKYDIILAINVLHFLTIKEIKKIIPKILNSLKENGYLFLEMFNSPVADWINKKIENFKVADYTIWIQKDRKPHLHAHTMVRWVIRK